MMMVEISDYLVYRFQKRSGVHDASKEYIRELWRNAEKTNDLENGEERYDHRHDVLMVMKDGTIKTVLLGDLLGKVVKNRMCKYCGYNRLEKEECRKCCNRKCIDQDEILERGKLK